MIPWTEKLPVKATASECREFLETLAKSEKAYHIDDSPETIVETGTDKRTFTDGECAVLRHNLMICEEALTWDAAWEIYWPLVKEAHYD